MPVGGKKRSLVEKAAKVQNRHDFFKNKLHVCVCLSSMRQGFAVTSRCFSMRQLCLCVCVRECEGVPTWRRLPGNWPLIGPLSDRLRPIAREPRCGSQQLTKTTMGEDDEGGKKTTSTLWESFGKTSFKGLEVVSFFW